MGNDDNAVKLTFTNEIKGEQQLKTYEQRLRNIYAYLEGIKNGQNKALKIVQVETKDMGKEIENTNKKLDKMGKKLDVVFDVTAITYYTSRLMRLTKKIYDLVGVSSSYIENVNLLEVAYHNQNETIEESSKRIQDFIDKMSEVYGLDESRLTRQFGIFKQLANAMELPYQTAENLSEQMVKMTNDIASLYNLDLNRASNALQSALVGQVRPIRGATGADITEKTLQKTVDELGLERSISQLSFVEKRLVMVISLTKQLKNAQGDYARTIESASNQMRIFKEQWQRLARAIGNVFYPIMEKVLPVLNGALMALTEIVNILARLLGFKMPKFDYSGLSGISDEAQDIIEGMDGAGESADKLKSKLNGLRSFDKLNVINTPKDDSSNIGAGNIDTRILDAFNTAFDEYDDKLDEVRMKALDIRDAILSWLGVTDGSYSKLKLIGGVLSGLVGLGLGKKVANLINLLGNSGLFKILKKIIEPLKVLGGKDGLHYIFLKAIEPLQKLSSFLHIGLGKLTLIVGVVTGLALAFVDLYKNNEEFREKVDKLIATMKETLVPILKSVWETLKDVGKFIIEEGKKIWNDVLKPLAKLLVDVLKPIFEVIIDLLQFLWENVIAPLMPVLQKLAEKILEGIKKQIDHVIEVLKIVTSVLTWLWDNLLKPLVDWVVDKIEKWVIPAIESILGIVKKVRDAIQKVVDWWNELIFGDKKAKVDIGFGGGSGGGFRAEGGIFANGQWHDITKYAGGTTNAPVGQFFLAREKGAELVGQINGHTAVMNNDQIVASVSDGVYRAVNMANKQQSQPINLTMPVDIGGEHLGTIVLNDLQNMAKTNGKPIVIGG